jgi:hypothetical protein
VTEFAYPSKVAKTWSDFLLGSEACGHGVQVYTELDELAGSVATYFGSGFESGEPGVIVATAEHLARFAKGLAAAGWELERLEQEGLLVARDAEALLSLILDGEHPSASAFEHVVGGLLDGLTARFPGREIRVFGEMVDLLVERGRTEAAIALEELWNDLGQSRRFSLLCGYRLDVFDRDTQAATLPEVCRTHSHVLPAADSRRLARAVDQALEEVLGSAGAGKVYLVVADAIREERVPPPQLALMWVSANMPALADRILASARTRYHAPAAA